jgi:hypothetical protein
MIGVLHRPGMIMDVSLRLLYPIFCRFLNCLLPMGRTSSCKDVELLVLRHEVAVLGRTNPKPRRDWANRALFAALPPSDRSSGTRGCPVPLSTARRRPGAPL